MRNKILKELEKLVPLDKDIVYVNIGTPKALFDSFAPIFGSLLKRRLDVEVYGDLNQPIHALNIEYYLENVIPKDKFVIAIDSCVGKKDANNVGKIMVRDCPIRPGAGCGKDLPEVGDISIIGITLEDGEDFYDNNLQKEDVFKMAIGLLEIIEEFEEKRELRRKKEVSVG